jgi:hypothetical protein
MTIPAKQIVQVNPAVVAAGGNPLALNGLFLTESLLMPTKKVYGFVTALAVKNFFGPSSAEYAASLKYFAGYNNSILKPGTLLFAPFNAAARAGWVKSGSLAAMTLAQLQALAAGTITISLDGTPETSSSIDLSTATSFSNAATIIAAAFGTAPAVTWDAVSATFLIESNTTGSSSSVSITTGTLATSLKLTAATGAITSAGDTVDTPGSAMDKVIAVSQNWAAFVTMWEPNLAGKEAFAAWAIAQGDRYGYIGWDTDAQAIVNGSTTCFGAIAKAGAWDSVICISGDLSVCTATDVANVAFFLAGMVASINFNQTNGRITAAFKSQPGLVATCTDEQIAANLLANGYSYYGSYATANQGFVFFYNGQMPGKFQWIDPFVNQIYLNSQFQLADLSLLTQIGSIPYNEEGYSLLRASKIDPITAAINFGSIRKGVTLSAVQKAEINQAAGLDVTSIIESDGWYLQILDPGADIRQLRGTPIQNFWYTDGGSVQKLVLGSINIL